MRKLKNNKNNLSSTKIPPLAESNGELRIKTEELQISQFKGPLPDPNSLKKYNDISPEIVNVILDMAKTEQNRLVDCDKNNYKYAHDGLIFAFIIALLGIGGSIYLFSIGRTGEGATTFLTTTCEIILSFIYVHMTNKKENHDNTKRINNNINSNERLS